MKAVRLFLILILIASASWLRAATHPVPLEANTDSAKCIECHEDKSKGKNVHSAIAMGCTACHQIRNTKDVTRVMLIAPTPQALCITCHADKNAADIKGKVHPPGVRDCLKCHDPHQSDNKFQLLKPTSGDKDQNLCLTCHTQGLNVPEKGSRHAAVDMGCETCHTIHKSGDPTKLEFAAHLNKTTPALCVDCHDPKDESLIKAHQGQPFGTANCVQCHNPHQSAQAKLMQKFTHPPFADKTCEVCHAPAKDGKVVLTQSDSKALCVMCHGEQAEKIEKAKVPHPGAQGDCVACHNPHAGTTPGFIQPDPVNACLACHSDQAEQFKKAHLHQPAFGQSCAICHTPHGGDNEHLLRAKDVNTLCLECHGNETQPQKLESEHLITIFNGQVKLPDDYFKKNKAAVLPLKYGLGHPVTGHPVSSLLDPKTGAVKTPLSCLTCHQPHSSANADLLVKDQPNTMAFCDTCHKNRFEMNKTGEKK